MSDSKVFMFPEGVTNSSIDPALLMALNQNGGFGGGNWMWIFFLWFLMPLINGGYGNNGFGNNAGFLANMGNNNTGRDLLLQAINGNGNAISSLANMLNTDVATINTGINTLQSTLQNVGGQVGMSSLEVINAIQNGNATLGRQLCECCCENRLLTTQQGYESRIQTIEQTNLLGSQADRNTASLTGAIADLKSSMIDNFCQIKERELQNKISTQGDIITQLRNQISNDHQTLQFNSAFHALDDKIDAIAAKQPNTVPVQWPNLTAVNTTPYVNAGFYGGFGWNNGWGSNSFWN
jgi:hypothetical protein